MSIGKNIRIVREKRGLSQRELGEMLNITQSAVGQFEKDEANPRIETLKRVATALNVPVSTFIDEMSEAQRIKSTWEWIQDNDQKRKEIITEILKTHNYKIEEKDIHWLTITDYQGFSFLVNRTEFEEMCLRCDKDIRYNIEKLLNDSREIKK